MTGLEKIVEKINEEANYKYNKIIEQGKIEANKIINQARADATQKAEKIILDAEKEAELKTTVAKSYAESITRNKYLEIKNAILNDVIAAAYEKVQHFNDKDYFDLIYKICLKNIQNGECKMMLNAKDIKRLPKDLEDRINAEVFQTSTVFISKEPVEIESGFILYYETFEIDCTLKSMFDQSIDDLIDILCPILFD